MLKEKPIQPSFRSIKKSPFNTGKDSRGEETPATRSLHLRWKEGIEQSIKLQVTTFKAPLSGKAEERVPRAALAGESLPTSGYALFPFSEAKATTTIRNKLNSPRHCEEVRRSNPKLYRTTFMVYLLIGDCFVPRNDGRLFTHLKPLINC